ncbi:MAG: PKD domain-containing protein [Salibacteraceae bacterium]
MRTNTFVLIFLLVALWSCNKDDEGDAPSGGELAACLEVNHAQSGQINHVFTFTNCSVNADRYEWDFGDGNFSTISEPTHLYDQFGDYTVRMTAYKGSESQTQTLNIRYGYYKASELTITNVQLGNVSFYGSNCTDAGHLLAVGAKDITRVFDLSICGSNFTVGQFDCTGISEQYVIPAVALLQVQSKISCWDGVIGTVPDNYIVDYGDPMVLNLQEKLEYENLEFTNSQLGYRITVDAKFYIATSF